jgi:hypothetical protein
VWPDGGCSTRVLGQPARHDPCERESRIADPRQVSLEDRIGLISGARGDILYFFLFTETDRILRSPGHVRRATSLWAGPLWQVRERQARKRVPTGRGQASLDPRRPLPSGAMARGARSSFFFRAIAGWNLGRSGDPSEVSRMRGAGGSLDRIWTNSRGAGTIRSLATNDVTI